MGVAARRALRQGRLPEGDTNGSNNIREAKTMSIPKATISEFRQGTKGRFKPQPSRKGCKNCEDKHSLEAQVRGIICKCACHKYGGY